MPLNGLRRVEEKPRGGIVSVGLATAAGFSGAVYDPSNDRFISVGTSEPFTGYVFREDKASYREETTVVNGRSLVRHTLKMEFPAGSVTRKAMEQLVSMSPGGFIAIIGTARGERLLAGYSIRFGSRFPLRLTQAASDHGSSPSDFPAETVTLVNEDTERSKPLAG